MNYKLDFTGKRVLVTGSTTGIGRGAAEAFHQLGATVAVNGRSIDSVNKAIEEIGGGPRLIAAHGDLSSVSVINGLIEQLLRRMGGLDILINNAGRGDDVLVDDISETYWNDMLALNLKGVFFTTQACLPALVAAKGCIVNVSSGFGVMGGLPGTAVYSATKSAIMQMTRMMALELAQAGVRVNTLVPGWIDTPLIRDGGAIAPAFRDIITTTTPMRRAGTPQEMAGAILYLCAPFASFTTGSALVSDGGTTSGHYV